MKININKIGDEKGKTKKLCEQPHTSNKLLSYV